MLFWMMSRGDAPEAGGRPAVTRPACLPCHKIYERKPRKSSDGLRYDVCPDGGSRSPIGSASLRLSQRGRYRCTYPQLGGIVGSSTA